MIIIEVRYKTSESILERGLRFVVEDGAEVDEVREIVYERILSDLGVTRYEWQVIE